jgi:ketosteroid isomerase-like protein
MANRTNDASARSEIEALEHRFWQSMKDREPDVATAMLHEPAILVSARGTNKFDRAQYKRKAQDDGYRIVDYAIRDLDVLAPTPDVAVATYRVHLVAEARGDRREEDYTDSSTWVKVDGAWQCVLHTESIAAPAAAN